MTETIRPALPVTFTRPKVCGCASCAELPNDMVRAFAQQVRVIHAAQPCDLGGCETCYEIALHTRLVGEQLEGPESSEVLAARLHRVRSEVALGAAGNVSCGQG